MNPLVVALLSCASAPSHHHHATENALDPEVFVAEALGAHPRLGAAQARADAADARVAPAGAWNDPVLRVAAANVPYDPLSLTATPMTGIRFDVSQRIPWPGKTSDREDAARAYARSARAQVDETANTLSAAVRNAFYELHFLDVSLAVVDDNLQILDGFIEAADAKYRVGRGNQQDVLRARIARSQLEERRWALKRRRGATAVRFNSLLGRDERTEVPAMIDVAISKWPGATVRGLLALAERQRPALRAIEAERAAWGHRVDVAERAALPDLHVGLGYTLRPVDADRDPVQGADFFSVSLGVDLPVFYGVRQGPETEAARREQTARTEEQSDLRRSIRATIVAAIDQIPHLDAQMALFERSIIPNAQQSLEADRIGYQVDQVDFLDLLDLEMKLLDFQVDFHRLHVEREKIIVGLAAAVGVPPPVLLAGVKDAEP